MVRSGIRLYHRPPSGSHVGVGEEAIIRTEDASVGACSVVLYDSSMEPGARLDALSLLMKGETLLAATRWAGIPAIWCADAPGRESPDERAGDSAA